MYVEMARTMAGIGLIDFFGNPECDTHVFDKVAYDHMFSNCAAQSQEIIDGNRISDHHGLFVHFLPLCFSNGEQKKNDTVWKVVSSGDNGENKSEFDRFKKQLTDAL